MNESKLERQLKPRHIELIALGGTIGVGLFLGSASTIQMAGPSVLICYGIAGLVMFMVMRIMGEMLYLEPVTGSFATYGYRYLSPFAGYLTAWCYWFLWATVALSEITAVALYVAYWFPDIPHWGSALGAVAILAAANLISVKYYGEFEFWFAFIKVATIIIMLLVGIGMIVFGLGNNGIPIGISNLWAHDGFFPNGIGGMLTALCIVAGAFQGVEVIGITAGEAQNPKHTLVKAIKNIVWRVLIFYIGAIFVIMSVYPWNELGTVGSPFVTTFSKVGITAAAGIINFVVLTAALSGSNTGIYSCGRMLYTLAQAGQAPKVFAKLSKKSVPQNGLIATILILSFGVLLNFLMPGSDLFRYIYSASVFPGMVTWFVLCASQARFRRHWGPQAMADHPFKSICFPYVNYACIGFLALVTIGMLIDPASRISLFVAWAFMALVALAYRLCGLHKAAVATEPLER